MDEESPSSRVCLACLMAAEQFPGAENDHPHTCQMAAGGIHDQEVPGDNENMQQSDNVSEDNPSVSAPETANSASNSSAIIPPRDALNQTFANDLLNVLNTCTRMNYDENHYTIPMNESTFANAMNSYLDGSGDRNVGNVYESTNAVSNASYVEGYGYCFGDAYPLYMSGEKDTRDACVMTDQFVIMEEAEDDDEPDYDGPEYDELEHIEEDIEHLIYEDIEIMLDENIAEQQNGVQNGVENGVQNGVQNGVEYEEDYEEPADQDPEIKDTDHN